MHGVFDGARLLLRKPFARRGCCFPANSTASAPRNWTRFAAQYPARGLPVNASRLASRPETRASLGAGAIGYILPREGGPGRLAISYPVKDLHLLSSRQLAWRTLKWVNCPRRQRRPPPTLSLRYRPVEAQTANPDAPRNRNPSFHLAPHWPQGGRFHVWIFAPAARLVPMRSRPGQASGRSGRQAVEGRLHDLPVTRIWGRSRERCSNAFRADLIWFSADSPRSVSDARSWVWSSATSLRYCAFSVVPTLFGELSPVAERGHIGRAGQSRSHDHPNEPAAMIAPADRVLRKTRSGYRPEKAAASHSDRRRP